MFLIPTVNPSADDAVYILILKRSIDNLMEEAKSLPFGAVFDYFNLKNNVPVGEEYIAAIQQYEKDVTSKR